MASTQTASTFYQASAEVPHNAEVKDSWLGGKKLKTKILSVSTAGHVTNKLCWIPPHSANLQQSFMFIAGSKYELKNSIACWSFSPHDAVTGSGHSADTEDYNGHSVLSQPAPLAECTHGPGVTDIKFVQPDVFAVGDNKASVTLYKLLSPNHSVQVGAEWCGVHGSGSGTVRVSCDGGGLVSAGEDGRLCLLDVTSSTPVTTIKADSSPVLSVCHVGDRQVVTGALSGLIKLWDLRTASATTAPQAIYVNSSQGAVCSVAAHPVQRHVLFAGTSQSSLCLLDLRRVGGSPRDMLAQLRAHHGMVNEVEFHPQHPDHLLTASTDGSVWHWDASNIMHHPLQGVAVGNPWFACGGGAGGGGGAEDLRVTSLLQDDDPGCPARVSAQVTSIGVERDMLLVATGQATTTLINIPAIANQ